MFKHSPSSVSFIVRIIVPTVVTIFFLLIVVPITAALAEPTGTTTNCGSPIGKLQTPTLTISISSCSFGLAFTIHTQEGDMLADRLLMDDLVAGFPDLAKNIREGLAGNDARLIVTH